MRGAPAIAILGCLSLAIEVRKDNSADKKVMRQEVSVIILLFECTKLNVIIIICINICL